MQPYEISVMYRLAVALERGFGELSRRVEARYLALEPK